ncbi:MAG: hypothetical protein D6690_00340 [Nitrospirae bacterium]|nr:MAG: hypothetical protein D6690_00340 [Nitrospirota bacterium]
MRMKTVGIVVVVNLLGLSTLGWTAGTQLDVHDGSAITITSPKNGDTVPQSFPLTYVLRKGLQADHVHVYLDGQYQKGFKGRLENVPPGLHTITVKVATKDHDMVAVSDSVQIVVQ